MASSSLQAFALCLLVLCGNCLASRKSRGYGYGQQQQGQMGIMQGECNLQNLTPLEPSHRIQHEAGFSEIWDENNEQMRCAGVAATRHVIQSKGLLLPSFNNAPMLVFVIQGNGILGTMFPGCPETYQSFQQFPQGREFQGQSQGQGQSQSQRFRDQHQKIHQFYRGDAIALPAGVAHWAYNEGQDELVLVVIHDTSNEANQLDQNLRRFFLAGNPQQQQKGGSWQARQQEQQQRHQGNNIFQGFDAQILAQAFGISPETARKLQNENDFRGNIVRVQNDQLRVLRPGREEEESERGYMKANGLEETICTMRLRENLANPERADVYTARGGSISTLNSLNLPILKYLQLSAGRGFLLPNAMVAPHWNINAHSISYVTRGNGRVQIVGNSRRAAYDGEVREGQLLIIPQNFVHVKIAGNQGLEWFTVKTNDNAKTSALVGKTSVIRAMPEDVLINSYQLSREEARRLKYNREEVTILSPQSGSESQQRGSPWSVV